MLGMIIAYFPISAPEARKKIAHGETVGLICTMSKPRQGRQKIGEQSFRPIRGLNYFCRFTHGFTVGYYRSLLRSSMLQ